MKMRGELRERAKLGETRRHCLREWHALRALGVQSSSSILNILCDDDGPEVLEADGDGSGG